MLIIFPSEHSTTWLDRN